MPFEGSAGIKRRPSDASDGEVDEDYDIESRIDDDKVKEDWHGRAAYSTASEDNSQGEEGDFATEQELRAIQAEGVSNDKVPVEDYDFVPIEPFHMEGELEEGHIDRTTGDYVVDQTARRQDAWLQDITEEQVKKARRAQEQRKIAAMEERAPKHSFDTLAELISHLMSFLGAGETPLRALARRRSRPGIKAKNKTKSIDDNQVDEERQRRRQVEEITELCTQLMDKHGQHNIYEMTREDLFLLLE